jgi:deltex-like protein
MRRSACPVCSQVYGPLIGNQPPGEMTEFDLPTSLPGFESCGTIFILYRFPHGTQGPDHPNPGKPYTREQAEMLIYPATKKGEQFLNF